MKQPVLEIGGTHVTAALVDMQASGAPEELIRASLPAQGAAADILERIAAAATRAGAPPHARWGVAVPGPFDYAAGIALFEGVGKFEALYGVDVGTDLRQRIRPEPASLCFLNDADAFGLGEYASGAAAGHVRAICLTLGSGVGSAFLADGAPVNDGPLVPPEGSAHRLTWDGMPLEDTVSRRGIRAAYARAALDGTEPVPDVSTIAARAREGDTVAGTVLKRAFHALGRTMAPWLTSFAPTVLVVGGSIATSWEVVEGALRSGLADAGAPPVRLSPAQLPRTAPLLGAAWWAAQPAPPGSRGETPLPL
ncbi:ROK family protein [Streptomyces sulphureus]|uniref:ROK family protein n=1 Tax=Streptomyces sulphureus TaxID=47758 RepID=UPI000363C040|nr:ROK family protein [Streptomyces sulphureus]